MMNSFDSYRIYYHSAPHYKWQVMLDLYMNKSFVGRAFFMKTGESLPANRLKNGNPVIYFPVSEFSNILLILAIDKPLYISVIESNGVGYISTSEETAGDLDNT